MADNHSELTHRNAPHSETHTRRPFIPFETLHYHEIPWRDRQLFLESHGYMLRPRLRPGWTPSWKSTGEIPIDCEDSEALHFRIHLVDATRISDGKLVYIKRVTTGDLESQIAIMLSTDSLRREPRNHSVPILDTFQDSEDETISYLVMPFLRLVDDPAFESIEEVLDCGDQLLEGLVFMHEQGVAHRDCEEKNLMMDAEAMYPLGFHPIKDLCLPDFRTPVHYSRLSRSAVGVRYYYVDYGISVVIPPDVHPKTVVGTAGRDQEVPELSADVPYDPFKVDIFIMGNVFRRIFRDKYNNVGFFTPLIDKMMQADPALRPSADQVLEMWRTIRGSVSALHRSWRPRPRDEIGVVTVVLDVMNFFRSGVRLSKWIIGWR